MSCVIGLPPYCYKGSLTHYRSLVKCLTDRLPGNIFKLNRFDEKGPKQFGAEIPGDRNIHLRLIVNGSSLQFNVEYPYETSDAVTPLQQICLFKPFSQTLSGDGIRERKFLPKGHPQIACGRRG